MNVKHSDESIYVFVYLGEFGYELMNWVGAIRKWKHSIGYGGDIICASRGHLYSLYNTAANYYVDISKVGSYQNTVAGGYTRICEKCYANRNYVNNCCEDGTGKVMDDCREFILNLFPVLPNVDTTWVFSSIPTTLSGVTFGMVGNGSVHGIYNSSSNRLNTRNNIYKKIEVDEATIEHVQGKVKTDLSKDYILCQTAWRSKVQRCNVKIDTNAILESVMDIPLLLLDFSSGAGDSYSEFSDVADFEIFDCKSFIDQAALINNSKCCLFMTEGDFRSHIYLPPFIGKDVMAVASETIYSLPSAPISFWNREVFKFGGRIVPIVYEDFLHDNTTVNQIIEKL